ncbi:MAG: cytidylate kinase-like family protein [Polyangiaceae bacterium]|nr:cytidylate kinase-like family protein [Polyangiaceae bacterium]
MSRTIEQLVNRQFLRWVEQQKTQSKREQPEADDQKPMIVVSREYGARGAEVGRLAAERLKFQFHSQELVHEVAKQARVRQQLVASLDERARDDIEQWVSELMDGGTLSPTDYLRNLTKVILSFGRHGKGVIVGRGAQYILDPKRTLRIRAFAPLDARVRRIASRDGLSRGEARAKILRIDSERTAFYRQHFDKDQSDTHDYDLLLNTSTLPVDACVDMVVRAFRARFR